VAQLTGLAARTAAEEASKTDAIDATVQIFQQRRIFLGILSALRNSRSERSRATDSLVQWSGSESPRPGDRREPERRRTGKPVSMRRSIPLNSRFGSLRLAIPLALAALLCGLQMLVAQTPQTAIPPSAMHHVLPTHTRARAIHPPAKSAQTNPTPATPPASVVPDWPVNDSAVAASVVWDSQGLRIDAKNSSLMQILKDFSTASGAQVEGLSTDERIFGSYGPGQARDVISQLLQGTGYNVIMIGDQGQGAPRQIVLSSRQAGSAQTATANTPASDEEDTEAEEPQPATAPPVAAPPFRPGFPPGAPMRSPQQMTIQEQQARQQQMQQQQQQQAQQPGNP
jgi:hypothetical protein